MCGIWAYLNFIGSVEEEKLWRNFMNIKHRGPDTTTYRKINNLYFGFHRLAIMDLSEAGDQPFVMEQNDEQIYPEANVVDQQFKSIGEALNWAVIQYSEYGVDVHPECAESKSMLKRIKAIARGQK